MFLGYRNLVINWTLNQDGMIVGTDIEMECQERLGSGGAGIGELCPSRLPYSGKWSIQAWTICHDCMPSTRTILYGNLRYGRRFLLRPYLGIQDKKVISSRHFHISRHRQGADPRYSCPVFGFFKIGDFGA